MPTMTEYRRRVAADHAHVTTGVDLALTAIRNRLAIGRITMKQAVKQARAAGAFEAEINEMFRPGQVFDREV